jgi:transcriptional regulator with XRE-family HTH domain
MPSTATRLPDRNKSGPDSTGKKTNTTVAAALRPYEVAEKLRGLRLRKKMGLVELGKHTGLSPAMLSKLERGRLIPTLPTLLRIAMVFSVGLEYFFTDERRRHVVAVVRREERMRFPERPGQSEVSYFFESLDFKANERRLNAYIADFQAIAPEKQKPHTHPGAELLLMLKGSVVLRIGGEQHELREGDAIYFDSVVPHAYRKTGKGTARAVVVTTG